MSDDNSYIGHLLAGRDPGDIEDWVDQWHDGTSKMELHEFLGLTLEEMGLWVKLPDAIDEIVALRREPDEGRRAALVARADAAWAANVAPMLREAGRLN